MTSLQRVIMALNFREPDLVPVCLAYETPQEIAGRYGKPYDKKLMRQDVYMVRIDLGKPSRQVRELCAHAVPENATIDSWGVATWRDSTSDSHHVWGPLQNMVRIEELNAFPFPEVRENAILGELTGNVAKIHQNGFAVQGAMSQTIFELAWMMYGMENLLTAFYENQDFAHRLLDEITVRKQAMARCFTRAGVDILRLGDDVGTQRGMMISPAIWRKFLKPCLAAVIAAARKERADIPVFYHSDGDIREIINELIEIGVTILNPVQPECMSPLEIKEHYGDRLTLWGTIGTQSVLPHGTPAEVRDVVRKYMEKLAPGGGYVIGPTHSINKDVSWENIVAFYKAVEDYGVY